MFVMLSVRTTSVRERHAKTAKETKVTNIDNTILLNKNSIEKLFTKSLSFEKNINNSNLILAKPNNLKEPPTQQTSVATILNDLSPIPSQTINNNNNNSKIPNHKSIISTSHMTPKGLQENSPDVKAMRYYRLWIYTCNAVLLMAVIVFCCITGKVLLADYRRLLVTGLNLGQPSLIYAYLALLIQSGFLQLIGCLGALRLSEKLLNAYWLLLLLLLIGDAVLGIFWMFKFDRIMQELHPMLRYRLANEYGTSVEFTELWDRLQIEGKCCGVFGPQDFTATTNRSYPTSCCSPDIVDQIAISKRPMASAVVYRNDDLINTKNNLSELTDMTWNHLVADSKEEIKTAAVCQAIYQQGCLDRIVTWLRNTADILFVLGYCVIAFLKICFLGILRYEIKEMIQKIKLLQTDMTCEMFNPDGEQHQYQQSCVLLQIPNTSINGGIHTERKVGNRDRERNRIGSAESEHETLLTHETPKYLRHKQSLHLCTESEEADGGAGVTAAKPLHGTNNYELTELETRGPTYRLINTQTATKI